MIAFERILCPIDQSAYSRRTVQHALALGDRYRADVIVMSVRAGVTPSVWPARDAGGSAHAAAQELFAFAQTAAGVAPAKAIIVDGSVVAEILRAAEAHDVGLLVVGMHGPPSGFQDLLLSPVTERIVEKAGRPVLAVARRPPEDLTLSRVTAGPVVCGVDRSISSRRALQYAIALSQDVSGRLIVVHALEDMNSEDPQIAAGHFNSPECWSEVGPAIRASYEELIRQETRQPERVDLQTPIGTASSALLKVAQDSQADLIVLGASGSYSGLGTTRRVLRHASCDALIVPATPRTADAVSTE